MPLNATNMVPDGHLTSADIRGFYDLLTGSMTDQPVVLANQLTLSADTWPQLRLSSTTDLTSIQFGNNDAAIWWEPAEEHLIAWPFLEVRGDFAAEVVRAGWVVGIQGVQATEDDDAGISLYADGSIGFTAEGGPWLWFDRDADVLKLQDVSAFQVDSSLQVNGTLEVSGNQFFSPDASYDIGAMTDNRPRDVYVGRNLDVRGTSVQVGAATFGQGNGSMTVTQTGTTMGLSATRRLEVVTANGWIMQLIAGGQLSLGAGGGVRWLIDETTGALRPNGAYYYDIGNWGAGGHMPNAVYTRYLQTEGAAAIGGPTQTGMGTLTVYMGATGLGAGVFIDNSAAAPDRVAFRNPGPSELGPVLFTSDSAHDIGTATEYRPRDVYVGRNGFFTGWIRTGTTGNTINFGINTIYNPYVRASGGDLIFGSGWNNASADRWRLHQSGTLQTIQDNTYDIGTATDYRPRDVYVANNLNLSAASAVTWGGSYNRILIGAVSGSAFYFDATNPWVFRDAASGFATRFTLQQNGTMQVYGNQLFTPDNTYDIGASGYNRPRDVYVGRDLTISGRLHLASGQITTPPNRQVYLNAASDNDAEGDLNLRTAWIRGSVLLGPAGSGVSLLTLSSLDRLYVRVPTAFHVGALSGTSVFWVDVISRSIALSGNQIFDPDNTYDIGRSTNYRPRDVYVGRNVNVGGTVTLGRDPTAAMEAATRQYVDALAARVAALEAA